MLFRTSVSEQIRELLSIWYTDFHKGLKMIRVEIYIYIYISFPVVKLIVQTINLGLICVRFGWNIITLEDWI